MSGDAEIRDFLTRYAATLTSFDAEAAAELWATPGLILDDRQAGVVASRAALAVGLQRSYPLYRRLGLASVDFELLAHERLSEALTLVHVRWLFYDADGHELTDSCDRYIVRRAEDGLRACVCIQVDDAEKLQALMARLGVNLLEPG